MKNSFSSVLVLKGYIFELNGALVDAISQHLRILPLLQHLFVLIVEVVEHIDGNLFGLSDVG